MRIRLPEITKHTILYGASLAVLLFLVKWLEVRYLMITHSMDIYIGAIAIIFTTLGIWLALKLVKPKTQTVIVEKEIYIEVPQQSSATGAAFTINQKALEKYEVSNRELEVLQLMAKGLSNQEIAEQLYVSQNTIKTHSSNLFLKLDVKRRTQAVERGRQLGLIG